ncbi:unnamed protein product [Spirodela intermedia]|uniref:Uncharacterized protein n=1 Tax=Spirodela intermedia TaxID=51605 RepID=A0A7I8JBH3_SPIIN|nr:unnamed protein product [Spirodela intermedia]CAA6666813.1 unnamed protein product [Spirodela intermedia]
MSFSTGISHSRSVICNGLKVIAINGQFPGPIVNVTTNYNLVVNVQNDLDEPLLITWDGIQHRKNSWQDGVLGTNCPIPSGWNWTYQFQVKDQIGSFFYFPSINLQRAAGGYGGIIVNNRQVIAVPFGKPDEDITIFVGDWYNRNHTVRPRMPDGVLINGKGPYRYNTTLPEFRIQNHNMLLVETEGSYTVQQNFTNLDIHVECKRWRCPSQPSRIFQYGSINVTQVYLLRNKPPVVINGKRRTTLNGLSYVPPTTPLRLADQFDVKGVYALDFPTRPIVGPPRTSSSIINGTYRGFIEIIFVNNDTTVQTYHMDGYAFFVDGLWEWTESSRGTYNKWDGVARCTTQVYPGAWTAILVSLDNVGVWNVRTENLDTWYLGQETYIQVVNPEQTNKTELAPPDNVLYCGLLQSKQK